MKIAEGTGSKKLLFDYFEVFDHGCVVNATKRKDLIVIIQFVAISSDFFAQSAQVVF